MGSFVGCVKTSANYSSEGSMAQRDALVQTDLINDRMVSNRLGGFRRKRSKHIGVSIVLQVVLMRFSMIYNISVLLVGKDK